MIEYYVYTRNKMEDFTLYVWDVPSISKFSKTHYFVKKQEKIWYAIKNKSKQ